MMVSCKSNLRIRQEDIFKLIDTPVIITVTKFDEDSVKTFSSEFGRAMNCSQPVIPIVIDSYGGAIDALFAMIDVCRSNTTKPISTIVVGKAMSCGAVLTTCGWDGYRYASPLSRIMIHDASSGSFGKALDMKSDANECNRLNESLYRIMDKNCKRKNQYFWSIVQKHGRSDWYMDSKEAKKHNIINHIGIPDIKISLDVKYGFGL